MEHVYETRRRTTYRSKISTQVQAEGYPSSLNCRVTHHVWIPRGERLQSRRIMAPLDGEVKLNLFFKLGRKGLKPETFINSSLFAEVINSLNTLGTDETISIQGIGETEVVSDISRAYACVPLKLVPLEEPLEKSLARRPIARLSSIDLEFQYTPARKESTMDAPTRPFTATDFDSLIHVQPLVLPLKSSLQNFMKRFVNRNLRHELPLVFNSQWQRKLQDGILEERKFARILTRFSRQFISDDVRVEISNLCKDEDETKKANVILEEECPEDRIARRLSDLQIDVSKLPNTTVPRPGGCRKRSSGSSLDLEAAPSDQVAASDHEDMWVDEEEEEQSHMADEESNSDVSIFKAAGLNSDSRMDLS
ncbi:hypothetical protein PTTG_08410 [Puccinia triticina 1-1 BBBD Race 1]|uniref:Uncharacterized protein n=2 Tax=Puccinia triticina TaxID=208348 RepID=A0A180H3F2_PUCT1|nr:uncharacterized protein PtA15_13A461 [Puccinia triticina]OAV99520.1 hypothetical protein PTTG_08410 [Puccinia triticina 1-1 BBBD Race 1]WAQ91060.1 hypothetical protein PtA15_13A461 [Puccinia triticina]WAR61251.1 hypothetical protein PtB15_13B504 [Puccinia triticina]